MNFAEEKLMEKPAEDGNNIDRYEDEERYGSERKTAVPPKIRQLFLAVGVNLVIIALCMAEGFTAILLPQLSNSTEIPIDNDIASWIASTTVLPIPFTCLLGGWLIEAFGRKVTFLVVIVPETIAWLLIYLAPNLACLLAGRFLNGVCIGCLAAPAQVYLAELSEPGFRGFLLSTTAFAYTVGIVIAHVLGTFLTWRHVALIAAFFPVAGFIVLAFCPESPIYLMKKGRIDRAKMSYRWARGYGIESEKELDDLLKRQQQILNSEQQSESKIKELFGHLKKPEFIKPLLILMVYFATMQWSGCFAMIFYTVDIMKNSLGNNINEYTAMLATDGVRLICTTLGLYLFNKLRRRFLTICSCAGVSVSLFALALCDYLRVHRNIDTSAGVMAALAAYVAFVVLGLQNLPWILSGELFPKAGRGFGNGITSMFSFALSFSVVKTAPFLFESFEYSGTFLLYGVVCFVGLVILVVFLPETKGITLQEIEDGFKNKSKGRNESTNGKKMCCF